MDLKPEWRALLNEDLKSCPAPSLPLPGALSNDDKITGQFFLQIEDINNVLASSLKQFSETTRRMLKIRLTDGKQSITVVENEKIPQLSVSLPPGTKVLISGSDIRISCGFCLLKSHHIKVYGGTVNHMLKAWEIHRDIVIHGKRLGRVDDRVPWIPFGQPLKFNLATLNFRAMEIIDRNADRDEDESEEENEKEREFALHRQQVLQEAKTGTATGQSDLTVIGPVDRRKPQFLQITANFMSAEEKPAFKPDRPVQRDARDLIDTSDPGVEPTFRSRGRGRGRGRGRRGRRRGGMDEYSEGARPRTANLMDFITHQLDNL
ncbi:tudor domain-containing protein 3-like [Paramacrobiotus metropolitanus]|uniref:tudor domain-containing protein 3-like n=1 Tax=Paramacrobiotus metropolitanus TaxID=2943436 RepID=UPI002445F543|nr:tudor domain-containing protein 3-like [Paramacrobiotus metropolitanus]XP_055337647.1 tudor domain-containing protein 3-like [Paramacrobiotus metropolitanus]